MCAYIFLPPPLTHRSRVSLSSLASTISLKLNPRRVSSGGHTIEEVTDLVKERSTSPSSEGERKEGVEGGGGGRERVERG